MITETEFLEFKRKYCEDPQYFNKLIFDFTDFPKRILIFNLINVDLNNTKNFDITEVIKENCDNYTSCGTLSGKLNCEYRLDYKNIKIIGKEPDNFHFFIFPREKYNPAVWVYAKKLPLIFDENFSLLIETLKRYNIPTEGFAAFIDGNKILNTKNIIEDNFNFKIKSLQYIAKNIHNFGIWMFDKKKYNAAKKLFNGQNNEAYKYHLSLSDKFAEQILSNKFDKKQLKAIRQHIMYCDNLKYQSYDAYIMYLDYLRCKKLIKTKDLSKYPKYPNTLEKLKFLHAKVIEIYQKEVKLLETEMLETNQNKYKEFYNKAKDLEYSNSEYSIIAVKDLKELITEGEKLHHCVSSYIDSVGMGKEYILFLRKNSDIETPYFTIDVLPNGKVRQIHGNYNCNPPEQILPFITEWATTLGLNISNYKDVCGHL